MMSGFELRDDGSVLVPPGRYYVGDPCYAFPNDAEWDALGMTCDFFESSPVGKVRDIQVVAFHTAHGDGTYDCGNGHLVSVDSGLIGIVPASIASEPPEGLFEIEFEDVEVCRLAGTVIWIGSLCFETSSGDNV